MLWHPRRPQTTVPSSPDPDPSMRKTLASLLLLALPATAMAQDTAAGERIYVANCMACHGMEGDGKGPAAAALQPPPADFTAASFWEGRTDDQLKSIIKSGKPGTSMMPFANLSDTDLSNLVAFLKTKKGS